MRGRHMFHDHSGRQRTGLLVGWTPFSIQKKFSAKFQLKVSLHVSRVYGVISIILAVLGTLV